MAVATGRGTRKVAALLVALGQDLAAPLIRDLPDDKIEAITREIVRMESLPEDERDEVFESCYRELRARDDEVTGGSRFARDLLSRTVGTRKAEELVARVSGLGDASEAPFEFVKQTDMAQMLTYFESEHPQTVALALAHMPHQLAAEVLAGLSPDLQGDVAARLARTCRTSPDVLKGVEAAMKRQLATASTAGLKQAGGLQYLREVLGSCDSRTERAILESLAEREPELARQLRDELFTFDDIAGLDDRSIQRLLREVDRRDLVLALRGATEEVKTRVMRNMSARSARILEEEIALTGPLRLRVVEEAQAQVVAAARRLLESEEIVVPRGREDVFVP